MLQRTANDAFSTFSGHLAKNKGRPLVFRELFELYVRGLKQIQATNASGSPSQQAEDPKVQSARVSGVLKVFKKDIDSLLLEDILSFGTENSSFGAGLSRNRPALYFPMYMAAPIASHSVLLPPSCEASRRKDIVLDGDIFRSRNVAHPYYQSIRKAVSRSQFGALHKDLSTLNHYRMIVPFSSLLDVKSDALDNGNTLRRNEAEASLKVLQSYLSWTARALAEVEVSGIPPSPSVSSSTGQGDSSSTEDIERTAYWTRTPPLTQISFSQESDILIALFNNHAQHQQNEGTTSSSLTIKSSLEERGSRTLLTSHMECSFERVVTYAKYLATRNSLKEQKAKLLNPQEAAGLTIPVVVGTRNHSLNARAVQVGVPTDQLEVFPSVATGSALGIQEGRGIRTGVQRLANELSAKPQLQSATGTGSPSKATR